ncbi:hypothetical protein EDB85DRAFT_2156367 [Lactarius pseudohatsudake]|nr:hypothetical protein EDB85DRAFT_2156367 [Lactarius pseudohatsudake]
MLAELSVFADVPLDVPTFSQTQGQAQNMKKHFPWKSNQPIRVVLSRKGNNYLTNGIDNVLSLLLIQTIAQTANKGKQKGVYDQSSAEVEQLLPVHDPRNLYASDSPVIEDLDSDEELYKSAEEVAENIDPDGQSDGAANKSISGPNPQPLQPPQQISTRPTTPVSHPSQPSFSWVPRLPLGSSLALPRNPDRVDQNQGTLGDSSNSNKVQQGSQAHIIDLLEQIIRNTNTGPTHRAGSRSGSKVCGRRGKSPVRRRSEDNALAKLVWTEVALLLSGKPPYGHTPPPSRLSMFSSEWENSGHGVKVCQSTAADFMVDLAGGSKSPWNVSAGRVFTDYFIEKTGRDDMPEMRKAVEKAFTNRVKSLKSQWKKDALSQTAKAAERSKLSRKQRKYQLFQHRHETAKLFSPLGRHIDVLCNAATGVSPTWTAKRALTTQREDLSQVDSDTRLL